MMLDIQVLDMAWDKCKHVVGLNIQNIILSSYQSGIVDTQTRTDH